MQKQCSEFVPDRTDFWELCTQCKKVVLFFCLMGRIFWSYFLSLRQRTPVRQQKLWPKNLSCQAPKYNLRLVNKTHDTLPLCMIVLWRIGKSPILSNWDTCNGTVKTWNLELILRRDVLHTDVGLFCHRKELCLFCGWLFNAFALYSRKPNLSS